jgi:hypothetical protein
LGNAEKEGDEFEGMKAGVFKHRSALIDVLETLCVQNGGYSDDSDSGRDDFEGMKVKPRKGDALLFYTFKPDGTHDKVNGDRLYDVRNPF